ncbi:CDF family Co(II)/Ni(II) efflux transporter DmeF [bacterium]|nr:CDF family Co(II)/Ni(II) efflux transporter DmeF [bacterium]
MEHDFQKILEKRTLLVVFLTIITMFLEIFYGYITHSMALLADGFHMGTHALALGITFLAYFLSRKLENSDKFLNGTDKIKTLAAYTSSIFLGLTGICIIIESVSKFINPVPIIFSDAILIAITGLIVNILSILIMKGKHVHLHVGDCKHHHHEETVKEDSNFKSAYLHILADVLTSVLAIFALILCKFLHVTYFDPCIGILGGLVIIKWSYGLIKDTVKVLLDMKC